ncbi:MAG: segregation and condensation protein A [Acidimicrobiales bacterium]
MRTPPDNIDAVPYEVQTPVFEGPFDLLLHLVLSSQVDVYEISLSAIVDGFVAALDQLKGALDLELATEFVLVAATLIELKTRGLLPGRDDVELDEELAIWEQRDLLLARLLECKTFKDASAELARLAGLAERSVPRRAGMETRFLELAPDLLAGVTPEQVRDAFIRAATPKLVPRIDMTHVAPAKVTVAEAVAELRDELARVGRISFRRLTQDLVERVDVIVRFLAVLELYKQGVIELVQATTFGSLEIEWIGASEHLTGDLVDVYEG